MNSFGDSPVTDLKVRQAINMAIDKDTLVQGVLDGYGQPCNSLALPMFEGYDESVRGYEYDPEAAKALLAEAGYPDGFEVEMEVLSQDSAMQPISHRLWEPSWQKWE